MEPCTDIFSNQEEKIKNIEEKIKWLREVMEIESDTFLKATKEFVFEWTLREMEMTVPFCNVGNIQGASNGLEVNNHKLEELKIDPKVFSEIISELVKTQLNIDDYWLHRNSLPQTGLSQDYLEFKKEKMRKQLNSNMRIILGCCVEPVGQLKKEIFKNKGWTEEKGKMKYVCFLRFSDEMTYCLNRYFELFEKLFVLHYEREKIKEQIKKGKKG